MKKLFVRSAILIAVCISPAAKAQQQNWTVLTDTSALPTGKAVKRQSFPEEFKLFLLNIASMRQQLFSVAGRAARQHSIVISLPDAEGKTERFEVNEASNFEPALQERFPEIRAYSGKSLDDPGALLKLSISPQGIQTMICRANGKPNEYIEPYSQDHTVYAVFKAQHNKGGLPWVCSTPDETLASGLSNRVNTPDRMGSSDGKLRTLRLVLSCNGEYANYFGANSPAQVALVLAAFNATLTRCNGVFERDLAIHLNLIPSTTNVIYYDPATDPYTFFLSWNNELMNTLHAVTGDANFDIGHMFGASGGGGNAGCVGCICSNELFISNGPEGSYKGAGVTSPPDGVPQGDNFDINFVAHEMGHQFGATHTFSYENQGAGTSKEPGSGITIMGYAGVTSQDVAAQSIDIFHETSIQQIQENMATKLCPVVTSITANNSAPVVSPVNNYTIPGSTPFALTGSATDANGDILTYCWEQNDNASPTDIGMNSIAYPGKITGPNWLSFSPVTSPVKLFPQLSTILSGAKVTGPLPGGDPGINIEALSSVSRTLNFRLTVRDNVPYSSNPPVKTGQTAYTDMTVTVDAAKGPFEITSQNLPVNYITGTAVTVTWSVNKTNLAPVNCSNVKISFSADGGNTFPYTLLASTLNDGMEQVSLPAIVTSRGRIKVEAVGNIFFDINNADIGVLPVRSFNFGTATATSGICPAPSFMQVELPVIFNGGYISSVTISQDGELPPGTSLTFTPVTIVPGYSFLVKLEHTDILPAGTYYIRIKGESPDLTVHSYVTFIVSPGTPPVITQQPVNMTACYMGANFYVTADGTGYQWQVSTASQPEFYNITGQVYNSLNLWPVTAAMNGNKYRCVVNNQCGSINSAAAILTVKKVIEITSNPVSQTVCPASSASFTAAATGSITAYQWQVKTPSGTDFIAITGNTSAATNTLLLSSITPDMNGNQYRCVITGPCGSRNSNEAVLNVNSYAVVTTYPQPQSVCEGSTATFSVVATGTISGYQWQVKKTTTTGFTDVAGATSAILTINNVTAEMSANLYRCVITGPCNYIFTNAGALSVKTKTVILANPAPRTVCSGSQVSFTCAANASPYPNYQWQVQTPGAIFTNIADQTSSQLTLSNVSAAVNGNNYRCMVTGQCGLEYTLPARLTVNSAPVITTQPLSKNVCSANTVTLTTVCSSTLAVSYQWQVYIPSATGRSGADGNSVTGVPVFTTIIGATSPVLTLNPGAFRDGYQYRCIITNSCGTTITAVAILHVSSPILVTANPADKTVCEFSNVTFAVTASYASGYQWQMSVAGGPYTNIDEFGAYSGTRSPVLSVASVFTSSNGNRYRCVLRNAGCSAVISGSALLRVNAYPVINFQPPTPVCITDPPFTLIATPAGGTFSGPGVSGNMFTPSATGTGIKLISYTVNNAGCASVQRKYILVNQCSARSSPLTSPSVVSVFPVPNQGRFSIRLQTDRYRELILKVYDISGRELISKKISGLVYGTLIPVTLQNAADGIYRLQLISTSAIKPETFSKTFTVSGYDVILK